MITYVCRYLAGTRTACRRTVSPIFRPEQDLSPGMTSPFRQVALKERFSSSGTPISSSSIFERIFCSDEIGCRQLFWDNTLHQCTEGSNCSGPSYGVSLLDELDDIPRVTRQRSHSRAWNELTVLLGRDTRHRHINSRNEAM